MNISVLGLGIIGSIWARNLMADGHVVRCWNRTAKDFQNYYASPQESIEGATLIFIVVADPPAVQSVLEQICPSLTRGQIVIQSSTISSEWTKKFAAMVEKTGAQYLEAPFTGSKPAAEKRQTIFYLGGDIALVQTTRSLLATLAKSILHIGPLGSASSLKLAMNLNIAGVAQALCESLALSRAAGITDDVYFAALEQNVSRSGVSDLKEQKLRQQDYQPQFSLKHMAKDLRLALETAADLPVSLEQTTRLLQAYNQGILSGWQEDDFIGLIRLVERG